MSDERDMLFQSLPPREGEGGWEQFRTRVLGRGASCPPLADLLELALRPPAAVKGRLDDHLRGCPYCRTWYEASAQASASAADPDLPSDVRDQLRQLLTPRTAAPRADAARTEDVGEFTHIVGRGDWVELEERLRPYIPVLLEWTGLDATLGERLLGFLLGKARDGSQRERRFRDRLPTWLQEFAETLGLDRLPCPLRREDWEAIIRRGAMDAVLVPLPTESPDRRDFKNRARRAGLKSAEALLEFLKDERETTHLTREFRVDLRDRVLATEQQAHAFFGN